MFKKIVAALFCGLIITTLLATYQSATAAEEMGQDLLRLHVLAHSDSEEDQALKYKVRDALLTYAEDIFADTENKEQAVFLAQHQLDEFKAIAEETLEGKYEVKVSIDHTFFPTKEYENGIRLPAGFYDALRVEIGEAKGKNWWCILYPPLCLGSSVELNEMAVSTQPKVQVKFKLVELWNELVAYIKGVG